MSEADLVLCPRCKEPLVFPRGLPAYCEECGWPDEDFAEPEPGKDPITPEKMTQIASATNRAELRQALKGISRKELAKAGIV